MLFSHCSCYSRAFYSLFNKCVCVYNCSTSFTTAAYGSTQNVFIRLDPLGRPPSVNSGSYATIASLNKYPLSEYKKSCKLCCFLFFLHCCLPYRNHQNIVCFLTFFILLYFYLNNVFFVMLLFILKCIKWWSSHFTVILFQQILVSHLHFYLNGNFLLHKRLTRFCFVAKKINRKNAKFFPVFCFFFSSL